MYMALRCIVIHLVFNYHVVLLRIQVYEYSYSRAMNFANHLDFSLALGWPRNKVQIRKKKFV